ncbi:MAG TPA: type II secretion system F family protein [Phycisphaerales bacterium]|nr:type II secretion system F family protein [Phycisphaerales bacterium]
MGQFRYIAFDAVGQRVRGSIEASSSQAVAVDLQRQGLTPIRVDAERERKHQSGVRLPTRKLAMSYQQLSDLLRAGVPLLRGLRLIGRSKASPRIASVFGELAEEVADGVELSAAMRERPASFSTAHVALVRAGEKAGILESVLGRLSSMLVAQAELRSKVMASLIYPAVLATFGLAILATIFIAFVPRFKPLFARLDGDLPLATRVVFLVSDVLGGSIGITVLVLAGLGVVGFVMVRRPGVREVLSVWQLRVPIVGRLVRTLAAARFCRLLGTLLDNGVPMLGAMAIAREAAGHPVMAGAIDRAAESVREGGSISEPLLQSGLFEPDVIEMISVAEAANNLGEVLVTIAETTERRVDRLLTTSIRLLEPLLLVLIALAVAFVAAGLLLPMAQLSAGL